MAVWKATFGNPLASKGTFGAAVQLYRLLDVEHRILVGWWEEKGRLPVVACGFV